MKNLLLLLLFFIVSCGQLQDQKFKDYLTWSKLPIRVTNVSRIYDDKIEDVIDYMNDQFDKDIFEVVYDGDYDILVGSGYGLEYTTAGQATYRHDYLNITFCDIEISSRHHYSSSTEYVLMHELIHCLGFSGHMEYGIMRTHVPNKSSFNDAKSDFEIYMIDLIGERYNL